MSDPTPPTPEEIAAACRAIRAGWSDRETERRARGRSRGSLQAIYREARGEAPRIAQDAREGGRRAGTDS